MIEIEQTNQLLSQIPHYRIKCLVEKAYNKRLAELERLVKRKATDFAYMELNVYMAQIGSQYKHAAYKVPFKIGTQQFITVKPSKLRPHMKER